MNISIKTDFTNYRKISYMLGAWICFGHI